MGKYIVKMELPIFVHPSATEDEAQNIVKQTVTQLINKSNLTQYGIHYTIEKEQ